VASVSVGFSAHSRHSSLFDCMKIGPPTENGRRGEGEERREMNE